MLRIALKCRTPDQSRVHTQSSQRLSHGEKEEKECKRFLHPSSPPMFLMPIAGVCKDVTPGP